MTDWQKVPRGETPSPDISIVVPSHNEAGNMESLCKAISQALPNEFFELIIVDDASKDGTTAMVESLQALDSRLRLLRLLRNSGQQAALRAGLRAARGQWIITMDADLEHPPAYLPQMLVQARSGFDVVQMVRHGEQPGYLKNMFSRGFYRFFNALADVPLPPGAGDFRLMTRQVCDVINVLPERRLFLRALLPQLGFQTHFLPYTPGPQRKGEPAFTFLKSFHMGVEALFSNSTAPLKWALQIGSIISLMAFAYAFYNIGAKFFSTQNVPGYTDVIGSVLLLGGLILLYLGVLGRYILVILDHLKNRPEYLIQESTPNRHASPSTPVRDRETKGKET